MIKQDYLTKREHISQTKENPLHRLRKKDILKEKTGSEKMSKNEAKPKNKSKRIANASLAVMGAGFLATLPLEQTTTVKIIQGGFEAGLVGGLADWFAVTALFRHPLNIPIPHTALLPKNRQKITDAILNIAEKELLNKNSIMEKISNVQMVHLVLNKMEEQLEKENTKETIKKTLQLGFDAIEKEKIVSVSKTGLRGLLEGVDTKQLINTFIDQSLSKGYDEKVYSIAFRLIEKKVSTKETKTKITEFLLETMEKKAENGLFKIALKPLISIGREKLASIVEKAVDDLLIDLQNEKSENRQNILHYIQKELLALKENEQLIAQINEKKTAFIQGDSFDNLANSLVDKVFEKTQELITNDLFIEQKVLPTLKNTLQKVKNNPDFIEKTENGLKQTIGNLVEENHSKIGALIKENLDKLNNDELTDLLENKIGKELSWIRVNGSLCGFLIGIGLSLVKIMTFA